jgi:hypothetical protein
LTVRCRSIPRAGVLNEVAPKDPEEFTQQNGAHDESEKYSCTLDDGPAILAGRHAGRYAVDESAGEQGQGGVCESPEGHDEHSPEESSAVTTGNRFPNFARREQEPAQFPAKAA